MENFLFDCLEGVRGGESLFRESEARYLGGGPRLKVSSGDHTYILFYGSPSRISTEGFKEILLSGRPLIPSEGLTENSGGSLISTWELE